MVNQYYLVLSLQPSRRCDPPHPGLPFTPLALPHLLSILTYYTKDLHLLILISLNHPKGEEKKPLPPQIRFIPPLSSPNTKQTPKTSTSFSLSLFSWRKYIYLEKHMIISLPLSLIIITHLNRQNI